MVAQDACKSGKGTLQCPLEVLGCLSAASAFAKRKLMHLPCS